jgi:hypothetical protein
MCTAPQGRDDENEALAVGRFLAPQLEPDVVRIVVVGVKTVVLALHPRDQFA